MIKMIAQATAPGAPGAPAGFPISMFAEMALIFGAFYFLLIAPQKKKQKEHEKLVAKLQSGDEIVTTGGIFGTKIEIGKGFVQSVTKAQATAEEKKSS